MYKLNYTGEQIGNLLQKIENQQGLIETTYNELKSLRDNSLLIPGQKYRITDYVTTTSQENTQSAGHQFDIIVTADSENTLNEVARACVHEGDTYFTEAGANLSAWQIWYCLDNDIDRFAWANTKVDCIIHLPVSDSMRESILLNISNILSIPDTLIFEWWDNPLNGPDGYGLDYYSATNLHIPPGEDKLMLAFTCGTIPQSGVEVHGNYFYLNGQPTEAIIDTLPTVINENIGKGVIYRMIDEWNNECPYDFKNIMFVRYELDAPNPIDTDDGVYLNAWNIVNESFNSNYMNCIYAGINDEDQHFWENNMGYIVSTGNRESKSFFTFSYVKNDEIKDASVINLPRAYCYGNIIKSYHDGKTMWLNNNVFFLDSDLFQCTNNILQHDCFECSFGTVSDNHIYSSHHICIAGNDNTINDAYSIMIAEDCYGNVFEDDCYEIFLGSECIYNTFGIECSCIFLQSACKENSFQVYCGSISLSDNSASNTFGNECWGIELGKDSSFNSFGNYCSNISFRTSASNSGILRGYCEYNHFDDGCCYNIIYNTNTANTSNKLQNINVNRGVSGTYRDYNTIEIPTLNADYEIQVAKNSSGEIKVYCEADLIS